MQDLRQLIPCRNIGILCGFLVGLFLAYVAAAETARPPQSKGEVLVFRRGKNLSKSLGVANGDVESQHELVPSGHDARTIPTTLASQPEARPVFHWNDVCYDVDIKGQPRRILSQVDGWVQPGKSTALMVCQWRLSLPLCSIKLMCSTGFLRGWQNDLTRRPRRQSHHRRLEWRDAY